jgi:hypothetical protein
MKKTLLLFTAFLSFIASALAQGTVSGTVVDAETKLPLQGASVFAQNTTIGGVTKEDGSFKLSLGKGGYELVISFTGYSSERRNIDATADQSLTIELKKEDKSLSEVVVMASNEVKDGWEKYGDFFLDRFIGTTPLSDSCILLNPEVLKFHYYKRSDKLKVLATEPLLIANKSLGYNLRYALDSFVYYYKTNLNSYKGNCLYQPMEGDAVQQATWKEARENVYHGSRLHFLRAYYDSTLKQEGFTVDMLSSTDFKKFNRLINPYDTTYYLVDDSTQDVELWFPKKVSITYNKQRPEAQYLQQMSLPADVRVQISYVDLTDAILIRQNGYFLDQRSWISQGYWSWKNLSDQLPYDYLPN